MSPQNFSGVAQQPEVTTAQQLPKTLRLTVARCEQQQVSSVPDCADDVERKPLPELTAWRWVEPSGEPTAPNPQPTVVAYHPATIYANCRNNRTPEM